MTGGAQVKSVQVTPSSSEFSPPTPSEIFFGLFGSVTQVVPSSTNLYCTGWLNGISTEPFQSLPCLASGTPAVQPSGAKSPRNSTLASLPAGYENSC